MTNAPSKLLSASAIVALFAGFCGGPVFADAESPDSPAFQVLTKGMPRELKERYRTAIAQDPEMRAFIFEAGMSKSGGKPVPAPAAALVKNNAEGVVQRSDGSGVRIPAGAIEQDLQVSVSAPAVVDEPQRSRKAEENHLSPAAPAVEFGPSGTRFKTPVSISLAYDPADLAAHGAAEDALKVYYWNAVDGAWEAMPSTVDKIAHAVTALTNHFSSYQVMIPVAGTGVAAADSGLGVKAAYVFPNPIRGAGTATIRVQPGLADSIEVRIYDVSGRKIHSASDFRSLGAFDDGNGLGPQFTYDLVWDVSGIDSGVYAYVITAKKAGQKDVTKTGRVGVIK